MTFKRNNNKVTYLIHIYIYIKPSGVMFNLLKLYCGEQTCGDHHI